jgi:hypothetical protein
MIDALEQWVWLGEFCKAWVSTSRDFSPLLGVSLSLHGQSLREEALEGVWKCDLGILAG